ncbi:transposase [Roseiflexus castenholzii]|uniref:transposase n=1 Tax=Roseiflexus castenholzii TaxID=120962 RepID=UPI001E348DBA|nr:transposase [Roseiflexus castenholzii]
MLARQPPIFVIDGSTVGRGCMGLLISGLSQRRALPITWAAAAGRTGHLPQLRQCALLERLARFVPADAAVTILGNGAYDRTDGHAAITARGRQDVGRTASDILLTIGESAIAMRDRAPRRGAIVAVEQSRMTAAQDGPVHALAVWDAADERPIYLVTTHVDLKHAPALYRRRAPIETSFLDQKRRGVRINRSRLSDPALLARLLIATTLVYPWVVSLEVVARRDAVRGRIHRLDRCDLRPFSPGLRLLAYGLRHQRTIPRGLPKPLVLAQQHALKSSVSFSGIGRPFSRRAFLISP